MRPVFAWLAAVTLGIGCSSGGDGSHSSAASLDCAWLAGNNCWKTTLADAESCLPAKGESGTFSADMKSCTYASGAAVNFDSALVLPVPDDPVWSFTVTSGGQSCLRLEESSSNSFSLTVNGQTYTESAAGLGLLVTCPDKTSYANSNAFDLFDCSEGGILGGGFPGKAWSDSSTSLSFSLIGAANGSIAIFSCRKP